jgi:hypothetical protein
MKGFLMGLVVAALGFGGYTVWKQRERSAARAPVVADGGTPAREAHEKKKRRRRGALRIARNDTFYGAAPATEAPSSGPSPTEAAPADVFGGPGPSRSPRPAGAGRGPRPAGAGRRPPPPPIVDEPEPVKLSAADLRMVAQGDDLSRPDVVHLDMSDDSGSHELSQDDIDARFRAKEEAILGCIARARPDEETWVPGRVTVKFRIQRTGTVRGVRVEAPAILQRGGLYGCVKGVVGGMRFPPSSGSQVVTYPFSLT